MSVRMGWACMSVYMWWKDQPGNDWACFPKIEIFGGEKNRAHLYIQKTNLYHTDPYRFLSYGERCVIRLFAACMHCVTRNHIQKHVVKVIWLTWLKSTKRDVVFRWLLFLLLSSSIIIWPILEAMSTKDMLIAHSLNNQRIFRTAVYVHVYTFINMQTENQVRGRKKERERWKKATLLTLHLFCSQQPKIRCILLFFYYLEIPICWKKINWKIEF